MISEIVSKLSKPFKELEDRDNCRDEEMAVRIVEDMKANTSAYETVELQSIVNEIENIIKTKTVYEDVELVIVIDDSYSKVEVSTYILQVILDILYNAVVAFDDNVNRKEIKIQFIANEYGLEIECCDNAQVIDKEIENKKRDTTLYLARAIVQNIFKGKIDPSSREFSRSSIYPVDNSGKSCFYIAIPYSKNCLAKEAY